MDTKEKITQELIKAYKARENGNEGRARVCARRAAGWAVQEHLKGKGVDLNTPSAMDYIKFLADHKDTPAEVKEALYYLTQKVVKDSPNENGIF